jgi:hypothetical protein
MEVFIMRESVTSEELMAVVRTWEREACEDIRRANKSQSNFDEDLWRRAIYLRSCVSDIKQLLIAPSAEQTAHQALLKGLGYL